MYLQLLKLNNTFFALEIPGHPDPGAPAWEGFYWGSGNLSYEALRAGVVANILFILTISLS